MVFTGDCNRRRPESNARRSPTAQGGIPTPNQATVNATTGNTGGVAPTGQTIAPAAGGNPPNVGTVAPNTSSGIPFLGFILFGMTLAVHQVRVRRELTRI